MDALKEAQNTLLKCEIGELKIMSLVNGYPFTLLLLDVVGVVSDMGMIKGYLYVTSNKTPKYVAFDVVEKDYSQSRLFDSIVIAYLTT